MISPRLFSVQRAEGLHRAGYGFIYHTAKLYYLLLQDPEVLDECFTWHNNSFRTCAYGRMLAILIRSVR